MKLYDLTVSGEFIGTMGLGAIADYLSCNRMLKENENKVLIPSDRVKIIKEDGTEYIHPEWDSQTDWRESAK